MLGFDPITSASEPCCPTHYSIGTIQILSKINEIKKYIWHDINSNSDLLLEESFPEPLCRIFPNIKNVGKNTLKGKKNDFTD